MASSHGKQNGTSITNVAALADVSIATVSRVLSGRRTKDDDIARRVRKAAHELNYSVNSAASALRSDVSNTIALSMLATSTLMAASVVTAVSEAASTAHMQLLLGIDGTAAAQHRRIKTFCGHPTDGIIVLPCPRAGVSPPGHRGGHADHPAAGIDESAATRLGQHRQWRFRRIGGHPCRRTRGGVRRVSER